MFQTLQKNRQCVGVLYLVLICYLHPSKLIYYRYTNKGKLDVLIGNIITWREFIRFTRREQLCILIKYKDFGDHDLHCVQMWVIVIREGIENCF